jgi:hypothetical protein
MSDQPYHFSKEEKKIYQLCPLPLIVCQLVNGQYRVLLVSNSYCNMIHSDRSAEKSS